MFQRGRLTPPEVLTPQAGRTHLLEPRELVTTNLRYCSRTAKVRAVIAVEGDPRDRCDIAYGDGPFRLLIGLC